MFDSTRYSWPHLYLYSSADLVIPASHVEGMADSREKAGVKFVEKHNFQTSPHVLHFKEFPEQYQELCVNFVRKCLRTHSEDEQPLLPEAKM